MRLDIMIKEYPMRYFAGMSFPVEPDIPGRMTPGLWEKLGPQKWSLYCGNGDKTYGLLVPMREEKAFLYWTAVEFSRDEPLPDWIQRILVVGGCYATTSITDVDSLSETFCFLYDWAMYEPGYTTDMERPCAESYQPFWKPGDPIGVHVPLMPKKC